VFTIVPSSRARRPRLRRLLPAAIVARADRRRAEAIPSRAQTVAVGALVAVVAAAERRPVGTSLDRQAMNTPSTGSRS